VITLSDEEVTRWKELVLPIQEDFVAEVTAKGLPGQQALDMVNALSEKYNAQY
jgi:hypothetical protein